MVRALTPLGFKDVSADDPLNSLRLTLDGGFVELTIWARSYMKTAHFNISDCSDNHLTLLCSSDPDEHVRTVRSFLDFLAKLRRP